MVHTLEATWWESYICCSLKEWGENVKITQPGLKNHTLWKRKSLSLLPAGVFVWKDEYEALHEKSWRLRNHWRKCISPGESEDDEKPLRDRLSFADDQSVRKKLNKSSKLNFSQRAQDSEIEHLVMEGFAVKKASSEPLAKTPSHAPMVTGSVFDVVGPANAGPVKEKPWMAIDLSDPKAEQPWYTPARYFARQLVIADSTLLLKKLVLADKVKNSLSGVGIYKRGGKKSHDATTVLKAFANVKLG